MRLLLPLLAGTLISGLICAWASAYWLPIRDPKFVRAPGLILTLGLYATLLQSILALVFGAIGIWLRRQSEDLADSRGTMFLFGIAYAAVPTILDATPLSFVLQVFGLPYLLGFPFIAALCCSGTFREA